MSKDQGGFAFSGEFSGGMTIRQFYKGQIMKGYRPGQMITDQEIKDDIQSYCRAIDAMIAEDKEAEK